jgi:hypothetical protein
VRSGKIANYKLLNYKWVSMRRRNIIILVVAIVVAAMAITSVLLPRRGRPPEAARLLPAADAYIYIDLEPLRTAGLFKNVVNPDPDYAQFVKDTGFQFERDLDEAAFAVHLPATADLANTKTQPETRYSEVFVGRFDDAKLAAYLRKTAESSRPYGRTIIYSIPLPGRTVRIAVLSKTIVAASNAESDFVIRSIVDRYGESLGGGNELLRRYYRDVPLASVAWAIARTAPAGQQGNSQFVLPGGFDLFFPSDTVIVAAVRYLGSVQFRADAITRTQEDAQRISDQLGAYLALARAVEVRAGAGDSDLKAFFDSISVTQSENRAQLNATIPPGFVKKIASEPPVEAIGGAPPLEEKKSTTDMRRHRGKVRSKK